MRLGPVVLFERYTITDVSTGDAYLIRYRLFRCPWFGIFLHRILREDNDRDLHDHPWPFISIVLWGGYVEERPGSFLKFSHSGHPIHQPVPVKRGLFSTAFRRATDQHRITVVKPQTWTLFIPFGRKREWGFQTPGGWMDWRTYVNRRRIDNGMQGVCPFCGSNQWRNSWGKGNAKCIECEREFNFSVVDGEPRGEPV